jgi:uncharacterized membrane protein YhaH (DUF805 family)
MATIRNDPRRYLLAVMAVALVAIVPLVFGFITTMPLGTAANSGGGSIVIWALLGLGIVALLVTVFVVLARCTRLEELEHETPDGKHYIP